MKKVPSFPDLRPYATLHYTPNFVANRCYEEKSASKNPLSTHFLKNVISNPSCTNLHQIPLKQSTINFDKNNFPNRC